MIAKVFLLSLALSLGACNPQLNWREIRIKDTDLSVLLPCKPDEGARVVSLGGKEVEMRMTGCDASDATFAVSHVKSIQPAAVPEALNQWRTAVITNMGATSSNEVQLREALGDSFNSGRMITAQGRRKDGTAVMMQGMWFVRGSQIFHAVVYAQKISPEITETFFPGLKLQ